MKKRVFYSELAYVFGLIILAIGSSLVERANFGMSMVVAPAYILHLKVSEFLPWFSFGVAEYVFQGFLVLLTAVVMRKFKLSYLFSFVTSVIYGTLLDLAISLAHYIPNDTMAVRILCFLVGLAICSFAISLFFNTYISPEAYELIVKEITNKFSFDISRVKTVYDCTSFVLAVALSFLFFGIGVFKGVGIGTCVCAVVNGFLIGRYSKLLNRVFEFKNALKIDKYFK